MKDHCTACCLLTFCGVCGVHRCYLDDCGCGILYLCTGGCMFIGVLIDCCTLSGLVATANQKYQSGGGGVNVVLQNNITGPTIANNISNMGGYQSVPQQPQYPPQYAQPPPQQYISAPPPQQPQYAPPPPQYMSGSPKAPAAFCASCGTRAELGARFCAGCGAPQ